MLDFDDTITLPFLVEKYVTKNWEKFKSLSKIFNSNIQFSFDELIYAIDNIEPEIRMEILRLPLFNNCLHILLNHKENPLSEKTITETVAIIESIFFDRGILKKETFLPDRFGKIYLPFTEIVIEISSILPYSSISILKTEKKIIIDGYSLYMDCLPLISNVEINLRSFIIYNSKNDLISIDFTTAPYKGCVPNNWTIDVLNIEKKLKWDEILIKSALLINSTIQNQLIWNDVLLLIRILIPLVPNNLSHLSCSSIKFPGIICIAYGDNEIQIAQAIIHESLHNKLFLFEFIDELVKTKEKKLSSPWKRDLRPPRGVLHGAFAFTGVAVAWKNILNGNNITNEARSIIENEYKLFKRQINSALQSLTETCEFTSTGEAIIEKIHYQMSAL